MRTLLIDNYDSFTYNLVHGIAAATGREPVVIRNDDPQWRIERLAEFDCVVISPGPGTPERAADFGICREVIERCELPLLGICLGHQGLAAGFGGTVERAPEPRHGRTSPVLHTGTGIFEGIPSPFEVVRYHSLTVTALPDELEAVAHTPDGVLMGIRHRHRPMWGLQFHPESICTQYGDRLLRNFAELVRRHHAPRALPVPAPRPAAAPTAPAGTTTYELLVESIPTRWDDEAAYDVVFRDRPYAFWLDSSRPDAGAGRFSIMGDASGPLARVATADVWTGTLTVHSKDGEHLVTGDFLDWLDQDLRATDLATPDSLPPCGFALGWVGYLGYELKAQCGGRKAHRSSEPDAVMVFADRGVVVDHATGTTHLLALARPGTPGPARAWLDETAALLGGLTGRTAVPVPRPAAPDAVRLRHDRDRYLELIGIAQEEIAAGETYEVCLTNMVEVEAVADAWQSYRLLRQASPAPFGALLQFDGVSVLSTSPERFLSVTADGRAESRPIKGTRPRGATPERDAALRRELATDEKDHSENLMIVDLVRNDLGRCAETGSVEARDLFEVETYDTVHQLVSTVRARLRADRTAVDCVRAAFPGGSMTGAPKIRTMRIIDRLEEGPRGVYSGAIGYFSLTGAADLSIVIRTAVLTPGRIRYGTGGAIVALSDPEQEFEETAVKAAPLLALTGGEFPQRHMARTAPHGHSD
ncbi:aminodeoxychorismate synthase component I [Streptomyces sp. RPT161]|uniref:aminodeoxychorismate synthase component I n=1 Tax=Streptomyces sp. RPT161 TaxID=3015993 RepID=UPI0022B87803|nr:aminodeoxychorismate synthase component I [Streptomyces sp. RPT161]